MNYTSFCETLKQSLLPCLAPDTSVTLQKIRKNNGILLDAYCIRTPGSTCSPVVYLDSLYEDFQNGAGIGDICGSILDCLGSKPPFSDGLFQKIRDFDSAKDRIAFRLISKESNSELLTEIPWVPYLDLAMVFYLYLESSQTGQTTALIHNQQMELWDKSTDDLYLLSLINTPALFPPVIQKLEDILYGNPAGDSVFPEDLSPVTADVFHSPVHPDSFIAFNSQNFSDSLAFPGSCAFCDSSPSDSLPSLYVLTNRSGIHGASCLLYHDIIKDFADRIGSDILILPSSIHEVILIPDNNIFDYQEIREMVKKVNSEDVPAEDCLSDQLYFYSRKQKRLTIWTSGGSQHTPEQAGK